MAPLGSFVHPSRVAPKEGPGFLPRCPSCSSISSHTFTPAVHRPACPGIIPKAAGTRSSNATPVLPAHLSQRSKLEEVRRLRMSNASMHVSPSSSFALHSAPATALSSIVGVQFAFFPWKYLLLIATPSLSAWQCIPADPPLQKVCRSARSRRSWACVVSCTCLCTCSLTQNSWCTNDKPGARSHTLACDCPRSHRLRPSLPIRHPDAWNLIYKSLYHCERNLGYAFPQSVPIS
jgi:hypothetical protein